MRRIAVAVMSTLSGLVLLFSYHTSTNSGTAVASKSTASPTPGASATSSSGSAGSATASPSAGSSGSSGSSASTSATYTGSAVSTRWGAVQVQITVANGKITAAKAIQYPTSNQRDQQINAYAISILNQEAVGQQSADIDMVSGATVTSQGYLQSLQSAIDQAHL
ncbi:MAG: FMN-binding protein [Dermatophilaceae bacterium]